MLINFFSLLPHIGHFVWYTIALQKIFLLTYLHVKHTHIIIIYHHLCWHTAKISILYINVCDVSGQAIKTRWITTTFAKQSTTSDEKKRREKKWILANSKAQRIQSCLDDTNTKIHMEINNWYLRVYRNFIDVIRPIEWNIHMYSYSKQKLIPIL